MKFNPKEDHAVVGGRHPLKYLQGGHGFNVKGEDLGRFNDQGVAVAGKVADPVVFATEEAPPQILQNDDQLPEDGPRDALEKEAKELGIAFRSTISDEKLAERIAEFKESKVDE